MPNLPTGTVTFLFTDIEGSTPVPCATRLVRTRDLVTAADLLGHSCLTTTRRYAKASMQELAAAVEALYAA